MDPKKAGGNAGFGKEGGQFFHLNRNEAGNKKRSEPVIKASQRSGVCGGWGGVVHTCTSVQGKGSRGTLCVDRGHGLNE